jgi:hypothetical protein
MTHLRQASVLTAVFFLVGVGFLCAAAFHFFDVLAFVRTAQTASGRVVDLEYRSRGAGKTHSSGNALVFTYSDASGQFHTIHDASAQNPATHNVGDEVVVLYQLESPEGARIRGFRTLWIVPTILGSFGLGFSSIGGYGFLVARKTLRRASNEDAT